MQTEPGEEDGPEDEVVDVGVRLVKLVVGGDGLAVLVE